LHHHEDEWFHAVEGDYIVEVGSERFRLQRGDSILGPREVPHAWAFIGDTPGKLLIAFAPANKMEEYFRQVLQARGGTYSNPTDAQQARLMRDYGMELIGSPLALE
jgi:Cupin domain